MRRWLLSIFILFQSWIAYAQNDFCSIHNMAFLPGEEITYKVYYNWGKLYVGAGEATFKASLEKLDGMNVYHVVGEGKTYRTYDWFFKVRDRYESYIDTATMLPLQFIRNVNEGGYKINQEVAFDQQQHKATSKKGVFDVPQCVQDVLSTVYYARNINFDRYNPNDKIPISLFLDDKVYHIYIRYLGKENVETRFGTFTAIKFKPLLIKGTIFEGGEKMTVWVSDDKNHIPLRIDTPITVGSIKVDMIGYKHLRYPFTSMIDKR